MERKNNHKKVSRRDFLKITGTAGLVVSGFTACNNQGSSNNTSISPDKDAMTYRTNSTTGDKVSLLGFIRHFA